MTRLIAESLASRSNFSPTTLSAACSSSLGGTNCTRRRWSDPESVIPAKHARGCAWPRWSHHHHHVWSSVTDLMKIRVDLRKRSREAVLVFVGKPVERNRRVPQVFAEPADRLDQILVF